MRKVGTWPARLLAALAAAGALIALPGCGHASRQKEPQFDDTNWDQASWR